MKRTTVASVNVLIIISLGSATVLRGTQVESVGDPELVKLVAMTMKNNQEQIVTWRGHAEMTVEYGDESGELSRRQGSGSFVIDRESDAARWMMDVHVYLVSETDMDDGTPLRKLVESARYPVPFKRGRMLKPGQWFVRNPGGGPGEVVTHPREFYKPALEFDCLDPLYFMGCSPSISNHERLMAIYKYWSAGSPDAGEVVKLTAARDGDIVKVSLSREQPSASKQYLDEFECDMSRGGNLVRHYKKSNFGSPFDLEIRWTYVDVGGLWVLESYTRIRRELSAPFGIGKWQFIARNHSVNQPVDPNEFTIEKLDIGPRSWVVDRIKGISYFFKDIGNLESGVNVIVDKVSSKPEWIHPITEADSTGPLSTGDGRKKE